MKRIFAICLLLVSAIFVSAQSSLTVKIIDLESNKGVVIVALLDEHEKDVAGHHGRQKLPDAMGKFGPKDFSEWLFDVSGDTTITLTANNLF